MNDGEAINEFFSRLVFLTNKMKSCGENIFEFHKMEKVLIFVSIMFYLIFVANKESKDLCEINLE